MLLLFVKFKEIKSKASELSHCLLTTKPSKFVITTKSKLSTANAIRLFPAKTDYLNVTNCSFQHLNAMHIAKLNN